MNYVIREVLFLIGVDFAVGFIGAGRCVVVDFALFLDEMYGLNEYVNACR